MRIDERQLEGSNGNICHIIEEEILQKEKSSQRKLLKDLE